MGNLADLKFDASTEPASRQFGVLPKGEYVAAIVSSEVKPTKAGTGEYLSLRFEVLFGDYEGRMLFHNINLQNPNATAVKIGREHLTAICRCVDVLAPNDSVELHGKALKIVVTIKGDENTIVGFKATLLTTPQKLPAISPATPW